MVKRALLIGSNYTATPANQLRGCIDDIVNVRNMLLSVYKYADSNIVVLRDDGRDPAKHPTRANILSALNAVIAISGPEDEVWVHYSGHGSQVRGPDGLLDEVIVPCDFMKAGFILDKELHDMIGLAKCKLWLFFDSCSSGSVCDLEYSIHFDNGACTPVHNPFKSIANPNIWMMSGCKDGQTSADAYDSESREFEGAFTDALLDTLKAYKYALDTKMLYVLVCLRLKNRGFSQIPVLSSSSSGFVYRFVLTPVPVPVPVPVKPMPLSVTPAKPVLLPMPVVKPMPVTPVKPLPVARPMNGRMGSIMQKK